VWHLFLSGQLESNLVQANGFVKYAVIKELVPDINKHVTIKIISVGVFGKNIDGFAKANGSLFDIGFPVLVQFGKMDIRHDLIGRIFDSIKY
jgi:hypothetical protein